MYEGAFEGNNVGATLNPILIKATPAPDLTAQTVSGPAQAASGEQVTVNWTVANLGEAGAGGTCTYLCRAIQNTKG